MSPTASGFRRLCSRLPGCVVQFHTVLALSIAAFGARGVACCCVERHWNFNLQWLRGCILIWLGSL